MPTDIKWDVQVAFALAGDVAKGDAVDKRQKRVQLKVKVAQGKVTRQTAKTDESRPHQR
jgi:hypothetical protein